MSDPDPRIHNPFVTEKNTWVFSGDCGPKDGEYDPNQPCPTVDPKSYEGVKQRAHGGGFKQFTEPMQPDVKELIIPTVGGTVVKSAEKYRSKLSSNTMPIPDGYLQNPNGAPHDVVKWRSQGGRFGFDELVLGQWFHLEMMDSTERSATYFLRIGETSGMLCVDEDGGIRWFARDEPGELPPVSADEVFVCVAVDLDGPGTVEMITRSQERAIQWQEDRHRNSTAPRRAYQVILMPVEGGILDNETEVAGSSPAAGKPESRAAG